MWGALIQLVGGLALGAYNKGKEKQAQNKLDNLGHTDYSIPQGYYDNVGFTQNQVAQGGFSDNTMQAILNQLNQNFASTTTAIQQSGGGANDIAKAYGAQTNTIANIGVMEEQLLAPKVTNLLQAQSTFAGQEALKYKLNIYDQERNNRAAAAAQIAGYGRAANSGLNTAIQGAGNLYSYTQGNSLEKEMKKMQKEAFPDDGNTSATGESSIFGNEKYPTFDNINFKMSTGNPTLDDIFNTAQTGQQITA